MGLITDNNKRILEQAETFEDADLSGMDDQSFNIEFARIFESKDIPVMSIVENANVSKPYINRLRSYTSNPKRPGRGKIIDISLAMDASYEEINRLLKAARLQELYSRDSAEALIIWALKKGKAGSEIRKMLIDKGLEEVFTRP